MTCEELTERIKKYRPFNEQEEADKVLILDWIRNNKNAFFRENMVAHMHTKILHLNLHLQSVRYLNYI